MAIAHQESLRSASSTAREENPLSEAAARLCDRRAALLQAEPRLRAREAAARLGVSEGELLAARVDGQTVVRLRPLWSDFLPELETLDSVMALSRNDHVVHERHGVYANARTFGAMGLLVNPDIDLRLFLSHWTHLFAVIETSRGITRRSFQVFSADGLAIHKIYATDATDLASWERVIERYRHADQSAGLDALPPPPAPVHAMDDAVDVSAFRAHWDALRDTHDFFGLLKSFQLAREQGLRLAGADRAYLVTGDALRTVLEYARDHSLPIMIFVGNRGIVQIHTGPVDRLAAVGEWFNVLDPHFNLHVRESAIASLWVVRKPTVDGLVQSLEAFDAHGELLMQMFGERKPGRPEDPRWRALLGALEPIRSAQA